MRLKIDVLSAAANDSPPLCTLTPVEIACAQTEPLERSSDRVDAVDAAVAVLPGPRRTLPVSARLTRASESTPVTSVSPGCMIRVEITSRDTPFEDRTTTVPDTLVTTGSAEAGGTAASTANPG